MATVRMPSSLQAQITRKAISPRLAIRIFLNMSKSYELGAVSYDLRPSRFNLEAHSWQTQKGAAERAHSMRSKSLLRPDYEQVLPVFDRLSVDRELLDDLPGDV